MHISRIYCTYIHIYEYSDKISYSKRSLRCTQLDLSMGNQPSYRIEANCARAFLTFPTCWLIAPFGIVVTPDNYNKINYALQLVEYRCRQNTTRRFIACDALLVSQFPAIVVLTVCVCVSVCSDNCAWAGDAKYS